MASQPPNSLCRRQAPAIPTDELAHHFPGGAEFGGEGRMLAAVVEEMKRHRDSFLSVAAPAMLASAAFGRANPPPPSAAEIAARPLLPHRLRGP